MEMYFCFRFDYILFIWSSLYIFKKMNNRSYIFFYLKKLIDFQHQL